MPGPEYYRKQAQLFAYLAITSSDPLLIKRYNVLALEHLARAEELEPFNARMQATAPGDGGSDIRD
jgi:hypothetical protein